MPVKPVEKRRKRYWSLYLTLRKSRYKAWTTSDEALFHLSFTTGKMKSQYTSSKKRRKDAAVLKNASWLSGVTIRHLVVPPLKWISHLRDLPSLQSCLLYCDGSKINTKVGLAFVIFQDFIEIGTRQFRIRDECSVFQAELLCIAQAVSWICNNEILSSNFLICSDSLSSLCALNNIYSQNKLIVKTHINLDFLRSRGVQVFFSFVRGHTGIYGNERADWLAKEATKLRDLVPMSIPKSYHKKVFKEKIISEWNNLYQISINANLTKEFFPSIQSRLKVKHFHPNFKLTQFLTGHGNFKAYLKRFNLSLTDQCSCSSDTIQNAKHLILACTNFSSERCTLMKCLQKNNIEWPPPLSAFVDGKSSFTFFCAFINSIFPCIN
ncbi:RNase H domain-containing protein [Trichonephila clavipes]|nr:RNase H domain-containing protein [Trichonephila clavipes]